MSASEFRDRIRKPYYDDYVESGVKVLKTMYDVAGVLTTDTALMTSTKFTVEVQKRMAAPSFVDVSLLVDPSNTSTMPLIKPTDSGGSTSSLPLSGYYNINCPDPLNPSAIVTTGDIGYNWWGPSVEHKI